MCIYNRLIKNPKYIANKKNGGIIPIPTDPRVLYVPIGCNKCFECMKSKANQWKSRLNYEIKKGLLTPFFVTLTFSTESLRELLLNTDVKGYDKDYHVCTLGVKRFKNRYRDKNKNKFKYWLVTEIGGKRYEHIHLHGIIWGLTPQEINDYWKYGYTFIGNAVNEKTVNYIVKYIFKTDEKHKNFTPKIYCSNGIGSGYENSLNAKLSKYTENKTRDYYMLNSGNKTTLPMYYRNKLYTDDEKEKLWIEKLNKNERYVDGIKYKADEIEYYTDAVKQARLKNKELGYGSPEDNTGIEDENYMRDIIYLNRINK